VTLFAGEADRLGQFPVAASGVFVAHAGVTALPACVARAMAGHAEEASRQQQEFAEVLQVVADTRAAAARAIHASAGEIALLGPTSLGLSLFANGLDWKEGDEVVCLADDYPSNVYPWTALERLGVRARFVECRTPGRVTVDAVRAAVTPATRLVALASCHFVTGWRLDVPAVGEMLRKRGVLFSLDAIQTVGAFETDASCVDFLSADAHKWMLGPMAVGIVFVAERNFDACRPTLLGAWNVRSPDFIAQPTIEFEPTARRYEPGVLNATGIHGMRAALRLLESTGWTNVSKAILAVRDHLEDRLESLGFVFLSPPRTEPMRSGILTARHPQASSQTLFSALERNHITASLRSTRDGTAWLRFSPHFYNTPAEMEQIAATLAGALT
jgi:cysteine desulfurase / selenocysteine lyase